MVKTVVSPLSVETISLAGASITEMNTLEAFSTKNLMAMDILGLMRKSTSTFGTVSFGRGILGEVKISDWIRIARQATW